MDRDKDRGEEEQRRNSEGMEVGTEETMEEEVC